MSTIDSLIDRTIDSAQESVTEVLEDPPQVPKPLETLLGWILTLAHAIIAMIDKLARHLGRRITNIELQLAIPDRTTSAKVPISTTSRVTPVPSTSTPANRSKRCTKCHARGHDISDCRTTNPTAMRKRVATNSRLAKQARSQRSMLTTSATIPPPVPFQQPYQFVAPPPMAYANLVADSTELRRRAAQSTRDRRLHRQQTSTT
jgi:hypothetical protein